MKSKFLSLVKLVKSKSKRSKVVASVILAALIVSASAITFFQSNQKNNSTNDAAVQTELLTEPVVEAATSEPTTTQTPAPAPPTEAQPTNKPASRPTAQQPKYNDSTALPPATVLPPSFIIRISHWSITRHSPKAFQVPFVIVHADGHTASIKTMSGEVAPASPGMFCNPFTTGGDFGEIYVFVPDSVPAGQYTCNVTFDDGIRPKSQRFTFTVTNTIATTP